MTKVGKIYINTEMRPEWLEDAFPPTFPPAYFGRIIDANSYEVKNIQKLVEEALI